MEKGRWIGFGIILFMSLGFVSAFSVTEILNSWAESGVFAYVLPFLLIFALVYGILEKSGVLGENKGVHAIIAVALGLLSLVGDFLPTFFKSFAPYLGMGVSVLLGAIILLGLFETGKDDKKIIPKVLFGIGALIFVIVVIATFQNYNYGYANLWDSYGPAFVTLLIIVAVVALITFGNKKKG